MEQRKRYESQFTAQIAAPTSKEKLIAQMQKSFEKDDPIDVSKSSIMRLRRWAIQRASEDRQISYAPDRITSSCYWDGYMRAIDHILEMEDQ